MAEFQKTIKVNNNQTIIYSVSDMVYTIEMYDTKDPYKFIRFSKWDDYGFKSYYNIPFEENEKLNLESHTFSTDNPLYIPLLHLLNGKEELIIDDDETVAIERKYMKIYTDKDKINIDFINNLDKDDSFERFYTFIKNTEHDLRSKIDCFNKDTKERLYFFFEEVDNLFREENHQIGLEEYMINNNMFTMEESKKYVKKFNS